MMIACLGANLLAQQRIVADVKKSLDALTITPEGYQAAIKRLEPALSNPETKNRAETWFVAGNAHLGLYDKYVSTRMVGKKVNGKLMGLALINAYDNYLHALKYDTIYQNDNKGQRVIDKKTGKPKFKTKYSSDIVDRLKHHHEDFNLMGGELYNVKEWDAAYRAWEIYLTLNDRLGLLTQLPDTTIGQTRYYQAITLWQKGENARAARFFAEARRLGFTSKDAYDYALICLSAINDEKSIVELAHEAYNRFGTDDLQYIRILINNYIAHKEFISAEMLLDRAIENEPDDAELYNLKGLVIEQQHDAKDALPYYQKCVELDEDNAQGQFNLGRCYYNEATRIVDSNHRLSAKALAKQVNPIYQQALPHLEKAYQLDPDNEDAKNALRTIYYKLGDGKKLDNLDGKRR